jgi:Lon protease-like protein
MSEASDKVIGVKELPLFPLPIVLFPGVPLPLHIFEPRYRRMLEDIRANNNLLGLSYLGDASENEIPPAGHIGCVAEVTETQTLPDGRSNILTQGVIRYRVEKYVERGDEYLVAQVNFFEDEPEDSDELRASAAEVAALFTRIASAVRKINDERAHLPDISETEPQKLSFLVAAAVELDTDAKQQLLEMRSTSARLDRLSEILALVVGNYEERARVHDLAKGNGHSGKKFELE